MQQSAFRTWFLRGMFIFMAMVMFGGYTFGLFASTPVFQEFTGVGYSGPDSEIEEALKDLREDPESVEALQRVGTGYLTLAQQPGGEVETANGLRTFPEYTVGERERFADRAARAFRAALKIEPDNQEIALSLAQVYEAQGESEKATDIYAALAEKDPDDRDILFRWGIAAYQGQDNATAALALKRFLKVAPNDPRSEDAQAIIDLSENPDVASQGIPGL